MSNLHVMFVTVFLYLLELKQIKQQLLWAAVIGDYEQLGCVFCKDKDFRYTP